MSIRFLKPVCMLCAIGTMTLTTTLSAQQTKTKPNQTQESEQTAISDRSEKCLAKLEKVVELDAEQKQAIHEVCLKSQDAQEKMWHKFHQAQLSAIDIEAEMYSAMEARMSDSQKQTFAAARTSQQEKMAAGTYASDELQKIRETSARTEKNQLNKGDQSHPTLQGSFEKPTQNLNEDSVTPSESFVQDAIISPLEQVVVSLGMDSEESAKCKSVCTAYHIRLNAVWNEIHTLRNKLVAQEAKSIQAIAEVLTKEQISELEQHRLLALKNEKSGSHSNR